METDISLPPLTGIAETDQEILLHLNDDSLFRFCSVSKSARNLCNETFWWRKFVKEFGIDLEESKKNGIEIIYKKIYKQLRNLNDKKLFFESTNNGYIELVKRLIELKRVDLNGLQANRDKALRLASENGHLNVVKYLIENGAGREGLHADDDYALRLTSTVRREWHT